MHSPCWSVWLSVMKSWHLQTCTRTHVSRQALQPCIAAEQLGTASEELDSFCFQTVGYKLVPAIASCLELPLYRRKTQGRATQETVSYSSAAAHADDEVEDLHALLAAVKV